MPSSPALTFDQLDTAVSSALAEVKAASPTFGAKAPAGALSALMGWHFMGLPVKVLQPAATREIDPQAPSLYVNLLGKRVVAPGLRGTTFFFQGITDRTSGESSTELALLRDHEGDFKRLRDAVKAKLQPAAQPA